MDTCRASRYFVRRRKSCTKVQELVAYSTYPKLEMICDCSWHLIIGADVVLGPCVDVNTFRKLLFGALGRVSIETILADAGYDSESNHRFARDGCGVRSVIPPRHGRPSEKLPATPHRRLMKLHRDYRYGQRSQAEATISMLKRNLGSFVAARSDRARANEVGLKVLTHNIMLIVAILWQLFYRAESDPFMSVLCPFPLYVRPIEDLLLH